MTNHDYEYRGLLADTWDLFRGEPSTWEDKFFYEKIIQKYGQPVLDIGCGTGRLLLDFLSQGIDIDGLDNSPEMLILCREKADELGLKPNLFEQHMEALDLKRKYRTILVPSLSFQLVADENLAQEAVKRFYANLMKDGVLVMPFAIFWEEGDPEEHPWIKIHEKKDASSNRVFRKWSTARFDGKKQLQHTEDRYEVLRNGRVVKREHHQRSPTLRWYSLDQAMQLYKNAGFERVQALHGFEDKPTVENDTFFTIIGTK